ncbi:unnamed protein product, partial [marine sediment metagenome]
LLLRQLKNLWIYGIEFESIDTDGKASAQLNKGV